MGTIPSYPPPSRPLDGTEDLATWQDGKQVSATTGEVAALATELVQAGSPNFAQATGTANALTATLTPAPTADIAAGFRISLLVTSANTGGVTLAVNGHGPYAVTQRGSALTPGKLQPGIIANMTFDGNVFQVDSLYETFTDAARRIGSIGTVPVPADATDAQVMALLATAQSADVNNAIAAALVTLNGFVATGSAQLAATQGYAILAQQSAASLASTIGFTASLYNGYASLLARVSALENLGATPAPWLQAASINANGSYVDLTVANTYSGGTLNPFQAGKSLMGVRVWRQGFDVNGNPAVYEEVIPITKAVRKAWPNNAQMDDTVTGSIAIIRCWLASKIYSTDVAVVSGTPLLPIVELKAGWFTKSASNAPAQTLQLTANNSTVTSPPAVINHVTPHRLTVGNTISGEILAFHRNARKGLQVPCIKVTASDGTTSVSGTFTGTAPSPRTSDRSPVVVYAWSLDITSLTDNHIVEITAQGIPWIGTSASIADSTTGVAGRGFNKRHFLKHVAWAANPPLVYLSRTGSDSTGVCSTNKATAQANPCLTPDGAMLKAMAANARIDSVVVKARKEGSSTPYVLNSAGAGAGNNRTQNVAAPTFTYDDEEAGGWTATDNVYSFGAAAYAPKIVQGFTSPVTSAYIRFNKVGVLRTGSSNMQGSNPGSGTVTLNIIWDDCVFDNAGYAFTYLSSAADWMYGLKILNPTSQAVTIGGTEHRIMRGVESNAGGTFTAGTGGVSSTTLTVTAIKPGTVLNAGQRLQGAGIAGTSTISAQVSGTTGGVGVYTLSAPQTIADGSELHTTIPFETWLTIGCKFTGASFAASNTRSIDGGMFAFNEIRQTPDGCLGIAGSYNVTGFAIVQNLFERINSYEGTTLVISADSATGNTDHIIEFYNTYIGAYLLGRDNSYYDETTGLLRTQARAVAKKDIRTYRAIKSDIFQAGSHGDPNAGLHVGNWDQANGVDFAYEWTTYGGFIASATPEYFGFGSVSGSSQTVMLDPGFRNFQGSTTSSPGVYVSGQGGGDYRLKSIDLYGDATDGPGRLLGGDTYLSHDLNAVARISKDAAGCYA
ncbi:hypothetical protein [Flavisphingomonas formosensis]|uniref:hypothetical protein n=1 Tax=Flavisphingomonas formosensis TaxID=861534 RepID=UPI0012F91E9F|nr:hypothetical protein [Sphingomonas formosensis]